MKKRKINKKHFSWRSSVVKPKTPPDDHQDVILVNNTLGRIGSAAGSI